MAKELRDHERLTDRQRRTIATLYDSHGLDAVLERFGGDPWNLTHWSVREIREAERDKSSAGTDWSKRYEAFRAGRVTAPVTWAE